MLFSSSRPKPPPPDGVKSNPSKRHRDRLNSELDKLTNLLPFSEDVRARLDKLSVLRLSVGYLKVKSFFNATIKKTGGNGWLNDRSGTFGGNGQSTTSLDGVSFSEGELLLQALNGFVMVVTAEGYVFYASPTIQDYLGFHQSDVVHQSAFELIHTDDRAMFRRQLHFALNPTSCDGGEGSDAIQSSGDITRDLVNYNPQHIPPENSAFLERSFCCRFRCLLDNSSGFLALNFQGRLKYLHGQNKLVEDGTLAHPQLALFVIATPLQSPSILEIRSKTLLFQTKHKLDFTPMGIDTRGKVVLGYSEIELCMRGSGYQFIHAADMMYCADNHIKMIKTGESGLTVFRLLSKGGTWIWVQANARLVYKGGRPDFIIARQRALTNEEGEEHLRQRKLQLPFNCATGEGVLYEIDPTLDITDIQNQSKGQKMRKPPSLDPDSLLGCMLNQDHSVYNQSSEPDSQFTLDKAFRDSHALLSVPGNTWQPSAPSTVAEVKEEGVVKDMMESLQQIIGDSSICSLQGFDVDESVLKEWENTLSRFHYNNDTELNEIITNDILSYVEDALFKENGVQLPEHLKSQGPFVEVPECLPEMELQSNLSSIAGHFCPANGLPQPEFPSSTSINQSEPSVTTQLQGQFSLHTQNAANPGLPGWQQSQPTPQQFSKPFSSGQQNMTGFIGEVTDFQKDLLGELLPHTNTQGFGSGFLPQTTANSIYPQQGDIINNSPHQTTNSCMFTSTPQPSVNGMHYGSAAPRGPSESIMGTSVIPQEDTNISPMACQVPLGLTPDNVLAQQYLSCNSQTQVNCTIVIHGIIIASN
uniref:Aryl hydrocarbon receptor n=1 Tax=Sinocyclocheilus anshuiensis TaxID=1608454 RepID=A0A671SKF3_9TELE